MTGRARGRSRGRGRGGAGGDAARRPGEGTQQSAPEQVAPVGRGRSRGPPPAQAAAPAPQQQQKPVVPPTEAMGAMSVRQEQRPPVGTTGSAEQRPARRSRDIPSELPTKPAHVVDKKGGTGKNIQLVTNHFRLMTKTNFGVYQYNVSFNPEIVSKRLRVALLKSQSGLIGQVHAFDGMMLFLPKRLQDPVTKCNLETNSGNAVEMTITLTNEIPKDSPSMLQLYNIIFRRFAFFLVFIFFQRDLNCHSQLVHAPRNQCCSMCCSIFENVLESTNSCHLSDSSRFFKHYDVPCSRHELLLHVPCSNFSKQN